MGSGKPTSFDIAYLAGVSQPTVSRALRGDKAVSISTRKKIEQIAAELKYTVDKNASSLRSQRSNTLALLFFEDPVPDDTAINPFFLAMLGSITRACANRGLDLLISFQRMEDDWHTRYQDSHRADGLILLGYGDYTQYEERLEELTRQGTHFVRWGSVGADNIGLTVGSDNFGAGRQAGEHLLQCGRRKIAFLGHTGAQYPEFADRYRGLCAALTDAGFSIGDGLQRDALTADEEGYDAACDLLASNSDFDAVFAASDVIAIGAMRALRQAGKKIPADIAVVGFDDIPAAAVTSPPLTTLMQDVRGGGERLVANLVDLIGGGNVPAEPIPAQLIARASTGG